MLISVYLYKDAVAMYVFDVGMSVRFVKFPEHMRPMIRKELVKYQKEHPNESMSFYLDYGILRLSKKDEELPRF